MIMNAGLLQLNAMAKPSGTPPNQQAMWFDGLDDWLSAGPLGLSAFTFDITIFPHNLAAPSYYTVLSEQSAPGGRKEILFNALLPGVTRNNRFSKTSTPIQNDTWNHIICGSDGATDFLYVNGVENPLIFETTGTYAAGAFLIGRTFSLISYLWQGVILRITAWASALSVDDISTLFSGGTIAGATAQYYNTGNTLDDWTDLTGNGHDMTVMNGSPGICEITYKNIVLLNGVPLN